jgi:hypothetical protein
MPKASLYLRLREENRYNPAERRSHRSCAAGLSYPLSPGRYSGSADSSFEYDIHEIASRPFADYLTMTKQAELSDSFYHDFATDSFRAGFPAANSNIRHKDELPSKHYEVSS